MKHFFALALLLLVGVAQAYPPAPAHRLFGMVRSEHGGGARSNTLMRARVLMQLLTVVLFMLLMAVR